MFEIVRKFQEKSEFGAKIPYTWYDKLEQHIKIKNINQNLPKIALGNTGIKDKAFCAQHNRAQYIK